MSSNNNGPKGIEALFGIGQGLSRILEGLKDAVDTADQRTTKSQDGDHVMHFGKEGSPFSGVAGFRMRSALDPHGASKAQDEDIVANSRVKKPAPAKQASAEPRTRITAIDVIEEDNGVLIVAEIPGVAEGELDVMLQDTMLTIQTTGSRKYLQTVDLKQSYEAASMTKHLRNGILEIRFTNAAKGAQIS
jgi:HSP20 family molecular chaperone IbpA